MKPFLAGAGSALMLASAGFFVWQAQAERAPSLPAAPSASATGSATGRATASNAPLGLADLAPPPEASERTREEKRFARYDKDKNGGVGADEYLAARRKGFAKLDANGDGRLSFDEYAVKAVVKFGTADRDKSGVLNATEFAATRVVRKAKPRPNCTAMPRVRAQNDEAEEG